MKSLKDYPLITQYQIVSKLWLLVFYRLDFACYPVTLPNFPTSDAALLFWAQLWWPAYYSGMMGKWFVCILGNDGPSQFLSACSSCLALASLEALTHFSLPVRHDGNNDAFPTRCVSVYTQTRLILVYAGASSDCASLHVVAMGQTGVCVETDKLLRSDSSIARVKITSPWLVFLLHFLPSLSDV